MATPLTANQILSALLAEGCNVSEYRNWRTHNRGNRGTGWGPVHGVMIHHTVTSGDIVSVRLCYDGYSGLPGPLCHSVGTKEGTIYMVGHGRANHAGSGDSDVLAAVIAETSLPSDSKTDTDGNSRFYGIELVNLGNGKDPWPEIQIEAAVRWASAICRAHGWSERSVIGHKEWQPGKIDPTFDMNTFRARVGDRLKKEDDTMLSESDLNKIYDRIWKTDGLKAPLPSQDNPTWMPSSFIRDNNIRLRTLEEKIDRLAEALSGIDPNSLVNRIKSAVEDVKIDLRVEE